MAWTTMDARRRWRRGRPAHRRCAGICARQCERQRHGPGAGPPR